MLNNNKYEILSPTGFQKFEGIQKIIHDKYLKLITDHGELLCSLDHKLIMNGEIILAKFIEPGFILDGDIIIWGIEEINEPIELYDLINVDGGHIYYTNSIISHNCDCSFITSGHTVVDGDVLEWYQLNMIKEPLEKRGPMADYWVWSYSRPNTAYVTAVDVGRGDGSDNSVINVFDVERMEQVAEWSGQIDTRDLGRMAVHVSMEYNNALLVIDNRNVGWDTVQEVIHMKYDNLHYTYRDDAYVDPSKHIFKGYDLKAKKDMTPGLTVTSANRPIMINKLAQAYREKKLIIHSIRSLSEMFVFKWINGKPQAQDGWHDDNVMTQAYFLYIRDTAIYLKDLGKTMTRKALDHMGKGGYVPKVNTRNDWAVRDQYGNLISTKWLL
jgi:hypothetical protein